ncbi:U3 small nucleolar RNA-associated protein 4 homolog [Spea bombifrons]|uniref:U3 small nucleolar RNA-associated protein 4 homolog n=1 Tax=Spea bombifrons TaxID=233779 RepID=UPI00234AB3FA|nr:U3 small nucleolar RNA-associated protein 4 homolog [Spea bombifrons]XP_053304805.1 U3 small nucleolar RNA-associated protein 4 homolog [Spea bombifrons]
MGEFKVHCVRFFDYVPSGVRSISYTRKTDRLALARNDSSVEVYNISANYYLEKVIPGDEKRCTEAICWAAEDRLFTAGLSGQIIEYDLEKLCVKYTLDAFGGPIWSIAANASGSHLAVCCEDGSVKLFAVTPDRITFERNLDRQKGRILCLAWHPSDSHIVTGSANVIRVFSVSSGHLVHMLRLDRRVQGVRNAECLVWSVAMLSSGDIISVDSCGKLQFWDMVTGTLMRTHNVAYCDIFCLAVSQMEDSLVVGTSEGVIFQFQLLEKKTGEKERQWVCTKPFRYHTHDVRAVAHSSTALISGGADGQLVSRPLMERIETKSYEAALRKIAYPHRHLVSCARAARMLLFQFPEHLELWRLGKSEDSGRDGDLLTVAKKHELLLQLKRKGSESIRCSRVSHCGSWISYATSSRLYLHRLHYENDSLSISRVPKVPQFPSGALQILFSQDSSQLYVGSEEGRVHVLELSEDNCKHSHTFEPPSGSTNPVHLMAASSDGFLLAVASTNAQIEVYNVKELKYECSVPQYSSPPTAIAIHPSTNDLVIAHADQQVLEFSAAQRGYTEWSRRLLRHGLHRDWLERDTPITGISFNPSKPQHILMHDTYMVCVLDKSLPLPDDKTILLNQKALKNMSVNARKSQAHAFKITKQYQPLLFMDLLDDGELVLVERPLSDIQAQLPPPIKQKKFGT